MLLASGHSLFMILFRMKHTEDHNARSDDLIENLVRKAAEKKPAKISIVEAFAFRIRFQLSHGDGELIQECATQSPHFSFVPGSHLSQISFGPRADQHQ